VLPPTSLPPLPLPSLTLLLPLLLLLIAELLLRGAITHCRCISFAAPLCSISAAPAPAAAAAASPTPFIAAVYASGITVACNSLILLLA
jgi:hypothetical protein